jgi:hypothetical protein
MRASQPLAPIPADSVPTCLIPGQGKLVISTIVSVITEISSMATCVRAISPKPQVQYTPIYSLGDLAKA